MRMIEVYILLLLQLSNEAFCKASRCTSLESSCWNMGMIMTFILGMFRIMPYGLWLRVATHKIMSYYWAVLHSKL